MFPGAVGPEDSCPPRLCVGVPARVYTARWKQWSSTRMETRFELPGAPATPAKLEIEGQDAVRKWAHGGELELTARIAILLNGTGIFSGPSGFARGGWSKRSFTVQPGILRRGGNMLEIANTSASANLNSPWFLLTKVDLLVGTPEGGENGRTRPEPKSEGT